MEITKKLDDLSELYAQRDLSEIDKQKLINTILTDEIKVKIAEIEAEFSDKNKIVFEKIALLENEIKELVKQNGASIKGRFLHAVFTKGRVSWDCYH